MCLGSVKGPVIDGPWVTRNDWSDHDVALFFASGQQPNDPAVVSPSVAWVPQLENVVRPLPTTSPTRHMFRNHERTLVPGRSLDGCVPVYIAQFPG